MVYIRSSKNGSEEEGSKFTAVAPGLLWSTHAGVDVLSKALRKNVSGFLVASPEREHCSCSGLAASLVTLRDISL